MYHVGWNVSLCDAEIIQIVILDQISIIIDLFHLKHGFYASWRIIQNWVEFGPCWHNFGYYGPEKWQDVGAVGGVLEMF